jgi:hypothetical protein
MTVTVETYFSPADQCWMNRIPGHDMQLPSQYATADQAAVRGMDLARFLKLEHSVVTDRGDRSASVRRLSYAVAAEQRRWATGGAQERVPHGTAHLVDVGSGLTLCGRAVAELELFPSVPVVGDYMTQNGCAECTDMADLDEDA